MKPNYDPESWNWIVEEFTAHVCRLCQQFGVAPGALMNIRLSARKVVPVRRELVRIMRTDYVQTERLAKPSRIQFYAAGDSFPFDTSPLSTTNIAYLFGGKNHSTIVHTLKRL